MIRLRFIFFNAKSQRHEGEVGRECVLWNLRCGVAPFGGAFLNSFLKHRGTENTEGEGEFCFYLVGMGLFFWLDSWGGLVTSKMGRGGGRQLAVGNCEL